MKLLSSVTEFDFKTALVRVDYNIPIADDGTVVHGDLLRVYSSLPTIDALREQGVRVILMTHIGRDGDTVESISAHLSPLVPNIMYGNSWDESVINSDLQRLAVGQIYMLPNVRTNPGEESNNPEFAKLLASFADIYINDAFSASHRNHASIVGVPKLLPSYAGYQLEKEVEYLSKLLTPEQPCSVIIGGAKFDTKMKLISKYLEQGNKVYVVGALAHPIYKAMGYEIGVSKCDDSLDVSVLAQSPNVAVPDYVVVIDSDGVAQEKHLRDIAAGDKIVDSGAQWVKSVAAQLMQSKTIIWNGPLGYYEGGFTAGTLEIVKILMQSKAYRVIGGGDTVACIPEGSEKTVADFISTGGGAMLDYLIQGTLPGIESLC